MTLLPRKPKSESQSATPPKPPSKGQAPAKPKPAQKPKPKQSAQDPFSWLDVVMPRQPVTRYGSEMSAETVTNAIKTLDNHTSRNVVIAKRQTPQGLRYSFRIEFREKVEIVERHGRRTVRRQEWQTMKQIDGTVMAGTEYPTIIEFTPQRLTTGLQGVVGICFLIFAALVLDYPQNLKVPLLVILIIMAGIIFLSPYFYVMYGPRNSILEQRMTDVMDKLGATKISDASDVKDSGPKPKRRAAPKPKIEG